MAKKVVKKAAGVDKIVLQNECPDHDRHLCHIINLRNMKTNIIVPVNVIPSTRAWPKVANIYPPKAAVGTHPIL